MRCSNWTLRNIEPSDLEHLVTLFRGTVHSVNSKDYTPEQLMVWAPPHTHASHPRWQTLLSNMTQIAEKSGIIVGFADLTKDGYLDRLFVHKDYQGMGIASQLVNQLEEFARQQGLKKITTEASITAKPFFEYMGYQVIKEQQKMYSGVILINYLMEKII